MLGVYDSGLGGLTVLRALREAGVSADIAYFADQAHLPYGDKTDEQLIGYLGDNLAFLESLGADAIVTACNTSCAVAQQRGWPATAIPVLDLIASAGASFAGTVHRRVAVVATAATVRSGAYARAIRAAAPDVTVTEVAAPALVPLVEAGAAGTPEARAAVAAVVAELPRHMDALIYGCTHYPMLDRWFAELLPSVARIDPATAQAAATMQLAASSGGRAFTTYYTNGDPERFAAAIRGWLGVPASAPLAVEHRAPAVP